MTIAKDLPIFTGLTPEEQAKLKAAWQEQAHPAGTVLFRQGDPPNAVYVVKRGSVKIQQRQDDGQEIEITTLYGGDILGEIGVLQKTPRTASAVVEDDATFFVIRADDFVRLTASHPSIGQLVSSTMFSRFRADAQRAEARKKAPAGGVLMPFFSVTGGSGISLVTANVAHFLKELTLKRVLVLDLDLMFGDQGEVFGIDKGPSLSYLVMEEEVEFQSLLDCIQKTESGVDVLKAPIQPEHAELLPTDFILSCIDMLRPQYDYILCDTAYPIQELNLALIERADRPFYVMTPEILSVKNTSRWFSVVHRIGLPVEAVGLIFNKCEEGDAHSVEYVGKKLGMKPVGILPFDAANAKKSLNTGKLVAMADPKGKLSTALCELAEKIAGIEPREQRPRSFWKKWLGV